MKCLFRTYWNILNQKKHNCFEEEKGGIGMSKNSKTFVDYKKRRLVFLALLPVLFIAFIFVFQSLAPAKAADSDTEFGTLTTGTPVAAGTVVKFHDTFTIEFFDESGSPLLDESGNAIVLKSTTSSDNYDRLIIPSYYGLSSWTVTVGYVSMAKVISVGVPDGYKPIKYVNEDGTVLKKQYFADNTVAATVEAAAPSATKAADSQYSYTLAGWNPAFAPVTAAATYTAQYGKTLNNYTVKFVDEAGNTISVVDNNGKTVESISYNYGTKANDIIKPADTPTKASDNGFDYTFKDWSPAITDVTADATYTASFNAVPKKFKINYNLDGGKNSDSNPAEYEYGAGVKSFVDATKDGYSFGGWYGESELTNKVTSIPDTADADVTLYAKFTKVEQATEATTQATTQATTEATTQATTEAPKETKVEQPTEAATQAPQKEAKKAQNTKSPGTGDSAPLVIAIVVMLVSLAGIVCVFVRKAVLKKNK